MGLYIKMRYYYIFLMCSPIFYYKPIFNIIPVYSYFLI